MSGSRIDDHRLGNTHCPLTGCCSRKSTATSEMTGGAIDTALGSHATRLHAALESRPKVRLGHFPTPLSRLSNVERHLAREHLYLKRDDLTGVSLGGNKVRGLEYLLGDAISLGADVVITGGGLQSNLCSLTAAACAKVGLRCVIVHNDMRPEPGAIAGNMLLNAIFGSEEVFIGRVSEEERAAAMDGLAAELRAQGSVPYVIHNGASTPMGALGYVSAALELFKQSQTLGLGLQHVAIVGAMGGTASGLVFGAAALGAPFHVHVISVEYPENELRRRITDLTRGIEEMLGIQPPVPPAEVMTIHDRYLGEGYGIPTPESREAARLLAIHEGIILENVYTSKTVAGFLDLVAGRNTWVHGPAACFHTGGMGALFAQSHPAAVSPRGAP
ncbi:MAG TPA: pyridoxal-phosphate dependent enzyme [Firmicutes bacterium]|nr:pyridoxal-phosphate dependent enzyme [Candidatus Fermentithermobacillaceae bacterium]